MTRALLALIVCWAVAARAEPHRLAIVVGNNTGAAGEPPLRYAEADAAKLARVLTELGGVAAADLMLLQGQGNAALHAAFVRAGQRIAALRRDPANRVVVVWRTRADCSAASPARTPSARRGPPPPASPARTRPGCRIARPRRYSG